MTRAPEVIPATTLHAQLGALATLGLDRTRIERDVLAVMGTWPEEPEGLVPVAAYRQMWRSAQAMFGADGLPTALAMAIPFGAFGAIDYLAGSANSLAGSIESLELHLSAMTPDTRLAHVLDGPDGCRLTVSVIGEANVVAEEFTIAVLVSRIRYLTENAVQPRSVSLRAAAPQGKCVRERLFGVPVFYAQPLSAMALAQDGLGHALRSADPYLHGTLRRMAKQLHVAGSEATSELEQAIRARLRDALCSGDVEPLRLARLLGLSERTLQRRLGELGRSFTAIVEDFRREEAAFLLTEGRHALVEVAARLGYVEQTSFTRAFRRWYGTTPGAWRRANAG